MYVEFEPAQQCPGGPTILNKLERPISFEPAKWHAILHAGIEHFELDKLTDLRQRIHNCWLGGVEFPCSLNLLIKIHDNEHCVADIKSLLKKTFCGAINVGVAEDTRVVDEPGNKIIPFPRRKAA